jgi:hypothetical protein
VKFYVVPNFVFEPKIIIVASRCCRMRTGGRAREKEGGKSGERSGKNETELARRLEIDFRFSIFS